MLEETNGLDLAAGVTMVRAAFAGVVLLVEGETDLHVFRELVCASCKVIPGYGKGNVIDAIRAVREDNTDGVIAIVDADFARVRGDGALCEGLFHCDGHDLEVMILQSRAFDRILAKYASGQKLAQLLKKKGATHFRDLLFALAAALGAVRHLSVERNWAWDFDGINWKTVVDIGELSVSIEKYVEQLISRRPVVGHSIESVVGLVVGLNSANMAAEFAVGRDAVELLCAGLRKTIGNLDSKIACADNMLCVTHLTFSWHDFVETGLYQSLRLWETSNPGYPLLRERAA